MMKWSFDKGEVITANPLFFMFTFLPKLCDVSPGVAVYEDEGEICPFFLNLYPISSNYVLNMAAR